MRLTKTDLRNEKYQQTNPTHYMHSIKHKVSPLHEPLFADHAVHETYLPSASNINGNGRTQLPINQKNNTDLRIDSFLESKMSETIPV